MASVASLSCSRTVSVISSSSRSGARPDARERARRPICTQIRAAELRRREVDGDLEVGRPLARPCAQACAEHPFADRDDQADLLGERDELGRRHHALLGMVPADQGLEAADLVASRGRRPAGSAARTRRLRAPCAGRVPVARRACICASISGSKKRIGAAAVALGAVQRQVGVAHQLVGVDAVVRADGDADAGADHDLMAVDVVGRAERLDDALRQRGGVAPAGDRRPARWRTRRRPCGRPCRVSRTQARAGRRPACSSLSPAGWPSVSLTCLKRSRSRTVDGDQLAAPGARARACSSRSLSSTRLGRPVSASCSAMCAILASERRCSVMSWWVVTVPPSAIGCTVTAMQRPSASSLMYLPTPWSAARGEHRLRDHLVGCLAAS